MQEPQLVPHFNCKPNSVAELAPAVIASTMLCSLTLKHEQMSLLLAFAELVLGWDNNDQ